MVAPHFHVPIYYFHVLFAKLARGSEISLSKPESQWAPVGGSGSDFLGKNEQLVLSPAGRLGMAAP